MADDEEAAVLACTSLVFCSLDLHHSQEQLLEKVRWTCPPQSMLWKRVLPVSSVALVVTIMSRLAVWQARHVSTRLVTSRHDFSLCQNVWARWRDVSRRDMTWHDESCGMWAYVCTESRPRYISVCVCVWWADAAQFIFFAGHIAPPAYNPGQCNPCMRELHKPMNAIYFLDSYVVIPLDPVAFV